jgi:precorrin-2 methylase
MGYGQTQITEKVAEEIIPGISGVRRIASRIEQHSQQGQDDKLAAANHDKSEKTGME